MTILAKKGYTAVTKLSDYFAQFSSEEIRGVTVKLESHLNEAMASLTEDLNSLQKLLAFNQAFKITHTDPSWINVALNYLICSVYKEMSNKELFEREQVD